MSAYNIIFASAKNLKTKLNLLFEGVCGAEMGSSASHSQYIFCNNVDLFDGGSLLFSQQSFIQDDIEDFPVFK